MNYGLRTTHYEPFHPTNPIGAMNPTDCSSAIILQSLLRVSITLIYDLLFTNHHPPLSTHHCLSVIDSRPMTDDPTLVLCYSPLFPDLGP